MHFVAPFPRGRAGFLQMLGRWRVSAPKLMVMHKQVNLSKHRKRAEGIMTFPMLSHCPCLQRTSTAFEVFQEEGDGERIPNFVYNIAEQVTSNASATFWCRRQLFLDVVTVGIIDELRVRQARLNESAIQRFFCVSCWLMRFVERCRNCWSCKRISRRLNSEAWRFDLAPKSKS